MVDNKENALILTDSPLECPVPEEILLSHSPLKLALAQIRFPSILSISQNSSSVVADFQEAIREDYPEYHVETGITFALPPAGAGVGTQQSMRHIFKNNDGWEVSLTQDFICLATTSYNMKDDFVSRVKDMVEKAQVKIKPHSVSRLGVRFVDRVEGELLANISKYVNPNFLGPYLMFGHERTNSLITETILRPIESEGMIVRWGYLPAGQEFGGINIPADKNPSWVLDSDIYTGQFPFDSNEIVTQTKALTERNYAFFRKVFNDEFIRYCGGKV